MILKVKIYQQGELISLGSFEKPLKADPETFGKALKSALETVVPDCEIELMYNDK